MSGPWFLNLIHNLKIFINLFVAIRHFSGKLDFSVMAIKMHRFSVSNFRAEKSISFSRTQVSESWYHIRFVLINVRKED